MKRKIVVFCIVFAICNISIFAHAEGIGPDPNLDLEVENLSNEKIVEEEDTNSDDEEEGQVGEEEPVEDEGGDNKEEESEDDETKAVELDDELNLDEMDLEAMLALEEMDLEAELEEEEEEEEEELVPTGINTVVFPFVLLFIVCGAMLVIFRRRRLEELD